MLQKPLGVCERGIRPTNEKYSARVNEYVKVDLGWFDERVTEPELRGRFVGYAAEPVELATVEFST